VLVSGPAHGALSFNEDGSFTYEPQAGFAGNDSFTYADEDGNTQSNTATVTIEVAHLDRAPEATLPGAQTVASGEALSFSSAGSDQISVTDSDSEGEAEKLTLKAAHGTLAPATTAGLTAHTGEGTGTLTLEGPIAALDEALEGLTYTAEASYGGADALTVEIDDLGHSGIGGPKTASGTVEITVLHTDQAPTLGAPASAETQESTASAETSIVFSKAASDEITYADEDSGGGSEQLVITAEHGALTPGSASGLTVTGSGTGLLTLEGSVAAIGEGLEGLTYKPELDYSGADALSLKASDLGHSGTGGPKTASASIAITIVHPNPSAANPTYSGAIGNTEFSVGVGSGGAPDVEQSGSVLSEATEPDGSAVHVTAGTISTEHGGSVSMKEDGTFAYEPPVGFDNGTDKFTYAETDTRGGKASGTVTIKVDNARVWYVNDNSGSNGNGESNSPFNVLSAVTGVSNPTSSGDVIFLYGGATSYTGGIALKSSQTLDGQSEGLTVEGDKLVNASGENPTVTNGAGAGVQLADGDAVKGITISGTSGAGVLATGVGGFTLDSKVLISGTTGTGLEVSGGSGTVTDEATINTSAAHSLSVANRTGGTFTASGPITDSGTGIGLSSNTGATIDLTGKLSLSTTSHTAFSATGGGTVAATGSENTAATTTGTAVAVQNTTISASGLKFRSVSAGSASGPTNGIVLENTGASGGLTVTGTGAAGSGGTIEHTTGAAIALKTTADTSLNEMTISTPSHSGVQGSAVENFQFTNGAISKAGAAKTSSSDAAIAFNETSGGQNDNVEGTVTITGDTLTEPYGSGVDIANYKGTISDLDVSSDTISSSTSESTSKGEGIALHLLGSTTTVASLTKAEIEKDTITNFPSGSGIDLQGGNTQSSTAPSGTYGNPGSATEVVKIDANEVHGSATVQCTPGTSGCLAHDAINAEVLGRGKGNFQIVGNGSEANPLGESIGTTIGVLFAGNVTGEAAIKSNTIAANNSAGSQAIGVGEDKNTQADSSVLSSPSAKVTISSNKITKSDKAGIFVLQRDSNGTLDLKLDENTIGAPLEAASGIEVSAGSAGSASFNPTLCSEIKGNVTTIGPTEAFGEALPGITLLKESESSTTYVFGITGLTPSPATAEQTESYVAGQNPSANLGSGGFYGSRRVFVAEGSQFTSCALPTMP
jgi:hypothetical protein